jgi:hypothetical protein
LIRAFLRLFHASQSFQARGLHFPLQLLRCVVCIGARLAVAFGTSALQGEQLALL